VLKNKPKWLKKGNFAQVKVRVDEPICLELFQNYKSMGRVAIRKNGVTVAAGTI
jgi:translation elongation factor EF-1alpha